MQPQLCLKVARCHGRERADSWGRRARSRSCSLSRSAVYAPAVGAVGSRSLQVSLHLVAVLRLELECAQLQARRAPILQRAREEPIAIATRTNTRARVRSISSMRGGWMESELIRCQTEVDGLRDGDVELV